jgi:hypothetical protein
MIRSFALMLSKQGLRLVMDNQPFSVAGARTLSSYAL